jgi:hypothetical protein
VWMIDEESGETMKDTQLVDEDSRVASLAQRRGPAR